MASLWAVCSCPVAHGSSRGRKLNELTAIEEVNKEMLASSRMLVLTAL